MISRGITQGHGKVAFMEPEAPGLTGHHAITVAAGAFLPALAMTGLPPGWLRAAYGPVQPTGSRSTSGISRSVLLW